jgi:hypothetical protein
MSMLRVMKNSPPHSQLKRGAPKKPAAKQMQASNRHTKWMFRFIVVGVGLLVGV